jgi:hypothetical protein
MRYCWLIIVVLLACEDKPVKVDLGTNFFPLRTGQEWTYSINKTTYSYLNDPIEESFELNIAATDSVISNGITTYSILVSSRNSSTESWQVIASWSARIKGNQALQNESNITRVKLTFPVGPATVWDGNAYNNEPPFLADYGATQEQLLFRIENFDQPKELQGGLNFENTLTVVVSNLFDPIIGQDLQKETYARGVGLIQKEVTQLVFCNQGSCTGRQQGVSYTQTLTSYAP